MTRGLLLLVAMALSACAGMESPSKPVLLPPNEALKEGRALAQKIILRMPTASVTNTGVLKMRNAKGQRREVRMRSEIQIGQNRWVNIYQTAGENGAKLTVIHKIGMPNEYRLVENGTEKVLTGNAAMIPFAGSDFWAADLGLEFLHWPDQRLLKKEMHRGQSCYVLESINPHHHPGAYSRVVSWIDIDTDGIITARADDAHGKLLKEFSAKSFKKFEGQWELKEIEMGNNQADSRTSIVFDVGAK